MILSYIQNMRDRRILRQSSVVNAFDSLNVEVACPEFIEGPSLKARISVEGKKLMLSLALLSLPAAYAHNANEQLIEYPSQDAYMIELYQRIVEFCKTEENPKAILVTIPLELILFTDKLPDELNDRIMEITQCIVNNEDPNIDADATVALVRAMIPYTKLIDDRIATSIKELQKIGVKIIAVSSFIPELADPMLKQMKTLGLDFSKTALYKNEMPIDDENGMQIALSKNGVVFMNDYSQTMNVLETMVDNSPTEILQLLVASPMQDEDIEVI